MSFKITDKRFAKKENIKPDFKFVNDLESIRVTIRSAPSMAQLRSYLPDLLMSTWSQSTDEFRRIDDATADKFIYRMFRNKFLPTAMETISLVVTFEGITWHDVTHLLRYRSMSFAGDCSGDKYLNEREITVPDAISENPEYYAKYVKMMNEAMELYCDMLNSGNVAIQDARLVLPRTMSTFYHVRMSLSDAIRFIKHRMDRQIQPKSDNIMAYQLCIQLCNQYPLLSLLFDFDAKDHFYIEESQTNFYSGFFKPYESNDVFEYDDNHFLFNCTRDELSNSARFIEMRNEYIVLLKQIQDAAKLLYPHVLEDLHDWR